MERGVLAAAAAALAIERLVYAFIWLRPDAFVVACRRLVPCPDPVGVLAVLFGVFKFVQVLVFLAWMAVHGGLTPATDRIAVLVGGGVLLVAGQVLNLSVFARLGRTGVFYGNRLGHVVPWCEGFPFSIVRHPQYVGTVLSIWGLFLVMRYPEPDWLVLPLLETIYYALGALVEQAPANGAVTEVAGPGATEVDQPEPASLP